MLQATEQKLAAIAQATQRVHQPLRGEAEIGMRVGKVINHYKVGKHFVTEITSESFRVHRDEHEIGAEQALDGLYIVCSNAEREVFDADQDADQTVRAYKGAVGG